MKSALILSVCLTIVTLEVSSHHLKKKHPLFFHYKGGRVGPIQKLPDDAATANQDSATVNAASPLYLTSNIAQISSQNLPVYTESVDSLYPLQFVEDAGLDRQAQVGSLNNQGPPYLITIPIGVDNPTVSKEEAQSSTKPETNEDKKPEKQTPLVIFPQNQIPNQLGFLQLLQQLGQVIMIVPGQAPVQGGQQQQQQQQQQQNGFGQQQNGFGQQQNFGTKQPYQPQGFYSTGAFLPGNPPYYNSVYLQPQPIPDDEEALSHSATTTSSSGPANNTPQAAAFVVPGKTRDQKLVTKPKKAREEESATPARATPAHN